MNTFEDNFDIRKISPNTWVIGTKYPATPWAATATCWNAATAAS